MASLAQSFGNTLQTLNIDTNNTEIPSSTAELLTNVFGNLKSNQSSNSSTNSNSTTNSTTNSNSNSTTTTSSNGSNKQNISVWKLIKISAIITFSFLILCTEFTKNLVTKVTNNYIITLSILSLILFMVSFLSIKWTI
jgi:hypothetical protein